MTLEANESSGEGPLLDSLVMSDCWYLLRLSDKGRVLDCYV